MLWMNVSDSLPGCSTERRWPASCREFGISRKTGYKIYSRYKDCGLDGLTDRSRRPYRQANQLPVQIEALIVRAQEGVSEVGGAKDSGAVAAPVSGGELSRDQYGARRPRPTWARDAPEAPPLSG